MAKSDKNHGEETVPTGFKLPEGYRDFDVTITARDTRGGKADRQSK